MSEQVRIKKNIKGEKPTKNYEIVSVRGIAHAKEVLDNFKNAILVFLENKDLSDEDPKWEELLPAGIVNKLKQLDDDDYGYDELLSNVNFGIYHLQNKNIREWEWYSSKEVENGFDIVVSGDFNAGQFISFIHCQNVPLANIRIINEEKKKYYELKTIKDYTTYKTLK
jgi:hypothetical protein